MSDWRELLDPELRDVLAALPVPDFEDYQPFRAASDASGAQRAAAVDISGLTVSDREVTVGDATVRIRLYEPTGQASGRPAILHIHGGGFVSGSPNSSHPNMVTLARELGAVIVSVDYRRSPEHPYPVPLEDCLTALRWLAAAADDLGVDRTRIAVHGISAGGALAAALAIRVRGEIPLCFQFLSVPIIDDRMTTTSTVRFEDTPLWNARAGRACWQHYLGALKPGSDDVPATAAPGRAQPDDLRGLPKAYIAVMELDPLCDEGLRYTAMLSAAGVSAEAHLFPGAFHAVFSAVPSAAVSRRYAAEEIAVLGRAFGATS